MQARDTAFTSADPLQRTGKGSIALLSIAAFVIVTTEFIIVGLLPALARELGISISLAGQLVTLFALTVAVMGPFMTAWLAHIERRTLFTWILLAFAGSNVMSALAPNYEMLALSRFIPAVLLPVFWGTASETASQLVDKARAGKAVSQIYLGVSAALLLGVPLGTLAAEAVGWRGTFWGLAGLSLIMAGLIRTLMPTVQIKQRSTLKAQARVLKSPYLLANLALSLLVFTSLFASYTYLADLLERIGGVPVAHTGWWLMGFGATGLLGNHLAGKYIDRHLVRATAVCCMALALGMLTAVVMAHSLWLFVAALAVWGIAHTALFPLCQVRVMGAVEHSQAFAGTLNISAANAGIGLGAMLGGWIIAALDLASAVCVAAGLAVCAGFVVVLIQRISAQRF